MTVSALMKPFDTAVALWREQEALGVDAPDVRAGDLLDIATELQLEIVRVAAGTRSRNRADIAAKEKIAGHIERVFGEETDEAGYPITRALRQSIIADMVRFGRIVLFEPAEAAA